MSIAEVLDEINLYLTKSKAYVLEFLLPGLSKDEIKVQIQDSKITFPQDAYELYGWRNGIANIYDHKFNHQFFLILEYFILCHQRLNCIIVMLL